ncbi:FINGER PROTEIN putative-RELATED [Salix purpurea]|uniref:FINGER PROTEIN putative-RELATED n=1 Tax=Salix purpurea TaxID=77065 RepID=A0A9Q0WVQ2_SALPP|nr:FINGER PROTEIN putative-RELATED [Salix purpurea]
MDLFVFVAEILGFHNNIPPFATAREADMLYGLNYASGSAGIRDETGQELLSAASSVSVRVRSKETSRVRTRENRQALTIDQLNDDLPDAKIIYNNSYRIGEDSTVLDLKVNNTACCPSSAIAQCIPGQIPCQNRTQYMFWDSFHPTEIFNIFYAERSYSALDPSYAYPYDIRHLISLDQGVAEAM